MRTLLASALFAALLNASALAQTAPATPADQDHAAHHPADASASAPAAPPAKTAPKASSKNSKSAGNAPSTAQMDAMMKSMQEMHDKIMAAKTPEERQALMNEHMKTMQEGMSMMGRMSGMSGMSGMGGTDGMGGMSDDKGAMGQGAGRRAGMSPDAMSKRMDMMEMMMQMMMDREAMRSSPAK